MLRECAQSIPRLEKPKNRRFSHKNQKMFDFRFNTPIPSLNQGQRSVFKVRECAQSISRIELLLKMIVLEKFFHEIVHNLYPLKMHIHTDSKVACETMRKCFN